MEKRLHVITRIMVIILIVLIIVLAAVIYFKMKDTDKEKDDAKSTNDTEQAAGTDSSVDNPTAMQAITDMQAGTVVDRAQVDPGMLDQYFVANEISDDIFQFIYGMSFVDNESIAREQLRYLKVLHFNYNHEVQVGELIVNVNIAEDVRNIFRELYEQEYEIQSMLLVDRFWTAEDNGASTDRNSIENNNTSAFFYRNIAGTDQLSNHAMGYAIDINPLQNPCVAYNEDGSFREIYTDMERYIDRANGEPHMIGHEDICYQIFAKYGFTWGGDWTDPIDYQHFEKNLG